ncbi:unnamed protein product [Durusdinium trenchii]|uniref:Uncharacterized protein n=1 Tax=Durusdinium trenchii TaxID=1381693 RepID=A0ABP0H901_9DINO
MSAWDDDEEDCHDSVTSDHHHMAEEGTAHESQIIASMSYECGTAFFGLSGHVSSKIVSHRRRFDEALIERPKQRAAQPHPSLELLRGVVAPRTGGPGDREETHAARVPKSAECREARLYYSQITAGLHKPVPASEKSNDKHDKSMALTMAALLLCITLGMETPLRDAPRALLFLEAVAADGGIITLSLVVEVILRAIVQGCPMKTFQNESERKGSAILSRLRFNFRGTAEVERGGWQPCRAQLRCAAEIEDVHLLNKSEAPRAAGEAQKEDVELSQSLVMARVIFQFVRVLRIASLARRASTARGPDVSFANVTEMLIGCSGQRGWSGRWWQRTTQLLEGLIMPTGLFWSSFLDTWDRGILASKLEFTDLEDFDFTLLKQETDVFTPRPSMGIRYGARRSKGNALPFAPRAPADEFAAFRCWLKEPSTVLLSPFSPLLPTLRDTEDTSCVKKKVKRDAEDTSCEDKAKRGRLSKAGAILSSSLKDGGRGGAGLGSCGKSETLPIHTLRLPSSGGRYSNGKRVRKDSLDFRSTKATGCAESVPHQAGIHVEVESFGERVVRSNTEVTCSQLETATSRDSPPSPASPATSRGETGRQTSQGSIPTLQSKPTMLADDQVSDISEAELLRRTSANPFAGHVAFEGPFCAEDAHRAGFFSILKPPDEGEEVVCFQRNHWLKRGIVEDVDFQVSTGEDGLMKGVEGAWVKVKQQDGSIFHSWAAFLSTSSDHEYSSLCLQAEYEASNFYALRKEMYGSTVTHETRVTKAQARASLESWLAQMIDADGEAVEISPEMAKELLDIFDVQQDASLHLYSLHKRLGRGPQKQPQQEVISLTCGPSNVETSVEAEAYTRENAVQPLCT